MVRIEYTHSDEDFVDCIVGSLPLRMVFRNYKNYPTDDHHLVLLKNPHQNNLVRQIELLQKLQPKSILEFGIFEGGSSILWSHLLNARYCGIDLYQENNPSIWRWIERFSLKDSVSLNFGVSQSDGPKVRSIVENWFEGGLDLVIDDASHFYEPSRQTFEIAFPMLKPGGVYLLEDWSWVHANHEFWQKKKHWHDRKALTNLVFDITMLFGSCPHLIDKIEIYSNYVLVHKSSEIDVEKTPLFDRILKQGREFIPF